MVENEKKTYINKGQAGAMGDGARSDNNTFIQGAAALEGIDLKALATELARLRASLKKDSEAHEDADEVISEVAKAEKAAKVGDAASVMSALKGAGSWALETATKIGVTVAAKAIEKSIGM